MRKEACWRASASSALAGGAAFKGAASNAAAAAIAMLDFAKGLTYRRRNFTGG